jgi:HPt (histidine-containing phosphotransfer) domain-containing protein
MKSTILHNIHLRSTIADLPLHELYLSVTEPGEKAASAFKEHIDLPGVIIMDGEEMAGMISRRAFHERVGRSFGVEVYLRRPLQTILEAVDHKPLCLDQGTSIPSAAQSALGREVENVYAPVVVVMGNGKLKLLDVYVLLLAQSRLLHISSNPQYANYFARPDSKVGSGVMEHSALQQNTLQQSTNSQIEENSLLDVNSLRNLMKMMSISSGSSLHSLANQLVEDIPLLFDDAKLAIQDQNPQALQRSAHTMRITANTFGLRKLLEYAGEMESIARKGVYTKKIDGAELVLENAMACFPEARGALFQFIASMQNSY